MAWRNGSSSRQGGVLSPVPGGRHTSESSLNARSPLRTIEITCSGRFLAALPSRGSLQPFFPEYGPVSHQPSRPPTLPSTSALYLIAPSVGTTMSAMSGGPSDALSVSTLASSLAKTGADIAKDHGSYTWLGLFGRLILWFLQVVSTIVYFVLKLVTISTPTFIYTFFSTSLTVTMNMTTLAVIMGLCFGAVTWLVRYRYLNMYSRLPPEPQRKEPDIDLFPDTQEEGIKSGLHNYFDEKKV